MANITRCDALQKDGLHYVDEDTGEEKIIPRCKINESEGYKYDQKTYQYKTYLMKECAMMTKQPVKISRRRYILEIHIIEVFAAVSNEVRT